MHFPWQITSVLADIYAARETDNLGISSRNIQEQIQKLGTPCEYFPTFDEIENFLLENCTQGDLLITMGAGDVVNIGEQLLGKISYPHYPHVYTHFSWCMACGFFMP